MPNPIGIKESLMELAKRNKSRGAGKVTKRIPVKKKRLNSGMVPDSAPGCTPTLSARERLASIIELEADKKDRRPLNNAVKSGVKGGIIGALFGGSIAHSTNIGHNVSKVYRSIEPEWEEEVNDSLLTVTPRKKRPFETGEFTHQEKITRARKIASDISDTKALRRIKVGAAIGAGVIGGLSAHAGYEGKKAQIERARKSAEKKAMKTMSARNELDTILFENPVSPFLKLLKGGMPEAEAALKTGAEVAIRPPARTILRPPPRTGLPQRPITSFSARERLNSIIEFGRGDQVGRLADINPYSVPRNSPMSGYIDKSAKKAIEADKKSKRWGGLLGSGSAIEAKGNLGRAVRSAMLTHGLSANEQLIELKAVDLGYTYGDMGCSPCDSDRKKHYPSLNIYDRDNDIDLPLSGTATVKYKLRSKTVRQNEEGKKKHSADIEIQSIDPIEEEVKDSKEGQKAKIVPMSSRDKLNVILFGGIVRERFVHPREQLASIIQFADPRPRNSLGEFNGGAEEGPSAGAMQITYGQVLKNAGPTLTGGAVAGTGALGAQSAIKALISKIKGKVPAA